MKQYLFALLFLLAFVGQGIAQRTPLKSGEKAPNPKITDLKGNSFKLSDLLKENKKVLITFMRPVWCPVCNARTHETIQNYAALKEKGYEVIVVYPSPEDRMKEYAADLQIPFIVVSDYNEELYTLFQIEKDSKKLMAFSKHEMGKKRVKEGRAQMKKQKSFPMSGDKHGPLISADFVIDNEMKLLNVYYGEFMGDHIPLDTL